MPLTATVIWRFFLGGGVGKWKVVWGRMVLLYKTCQVSIGCNHSAICTGMAAICDANFHWWFQSLVTFPNSMLLRGHMSVHVKWHLTLINCFSRVYKCDRQTDRAPVTSITIASIANASSYAT